MDTVITGALITRIGDGFVARITRSAVDRDTGIGRDEVSDEIHLDSITDAVGETQALMAGLMTSVNMPERCAHLNCTDRVRWVAYAWLAGSAPADTAHAVKVCGLHAKCWPWDYLLPFYFEPFQR